MKKNQGSDRAINVPIDQSPGPGTLSHSGLFVSVLSISPGNPPKAATAKPTANTPETIITRAWIASVQATERSPANNVQKIAITAPTSTAWKSVNPPSVTPESNSPIPAIWVVQ